MSTTARQAPDASADVLVEVTGSVLVALDSLATSVDADAQRSLDASQRQTAIILPTAPGGGNDAFARLMQKILQEQKLVAMIALAKAGAEPSDSVPPSTFTSAAPVFTL